MYVDGKSEEYCLNPNPVIDQTDVASAAFYNTRDGQPGITLTLRRAAAERFANVTSGNVGRRIAEMLNGHLISVPMINGATEIALLSGLTQSEAASVVQAFERGLVAKAPPPPLPPGNTGSGQLGAQGVYQSGGDVSQPIPIYKPEPQYTGTDGTVLLALVIEADGTVDNIHVVRPVDPDMDKSAINAVRQWRFRPAKKNGKPVAVDAQVEVNFRLPGR